MPKRKLEFNEQQLKRFATTVVRHAMGPRAFNAALAVKGQYQAVCGDHWFTTWFGPCRRTAAQARVDAAAHNAATGHNAWALGPLPCGDAVPPEVPVETLAKAKKAKKKKKKKTKK